MPMDIGNGHSNGGSSNNNNRDPRSISVAPAIIILISKTVYSLPQKQALPFAAPTV